MTENLDKGVAQWSDVPQLETTTVALGGPGGPMNAQAKALSERTNFLREQQDVINEKLRDVAVSPMQFGAVGDGVADDTLAVQNAVDEVARRGGGVLDGLGRTYLVTQPIMVRPVLQQDTALPGSGLFFSDTVSLHVRADNTELKAAAAMPCVLMVQYADGNVAPFYSTIEGFHINGNDLAGTGILSNYCIAARILHNRISGCNDGITYIGYGVAEIRHNTIKADVCINFESGGGDSLLQHNDLFPLDNGIAWRVAKLGGNSTFRDNIISGEGCQNVTAVALQGDLNGSSDEIRDVRILNNEFSGCTTGVSAVRHSDARNVYRITVKDNHTTPAAGGAVHTGQLCDFYGVDDAIISDNFCNGYQAPATITPHSGISLRDCRRPLVQGNKTGALIGPGMYLHDVHDGIFSLNTLNDVGAGGAGYVCVDIDGSSSNNLFIRNRIKQASTAYAQNSFYERAGCNGNEFVENDIVGSNRVHRTGISSVVVDRTVANGSFSLSGATASLSPNSHGFTVTRTAAGLCKVTLGQARPDANYRVYVTSDAPQVSVDSKTETTFFVRTNDASGVALDALDVSVEVKA